MENNSSLINKRGPSNLLGFHLTKGIKMGLDMYLIKKTYIGANWEHRDIQGKIELFNQGRPIKIDLKKVTSITEHVHDWRKANQIHKWFVDNCQNGKDNCQESNVTYAQLMQLRALCQKVLETKDASILPPCHGFFFGGTDIDQWYWQNIEDTIAALENLDPDADYYYQASW